MNNFDQYDLNGRSFELLLAVYHHRSVTNAAAQLDQSQSSVSHTLDKLRTCFGDPLFVKAGRGILPTEFTEQLVPQINTLLSEFGRLIPTEKYLPETDTREIRIASLVTELLPILQLFRGKLQVLAPNASLCLHELGARDNIEPLLERGDVEIVLSARAFPLANSLDSYHFFTDQHACFFDPSIRGPIRSIEEYCAADHASLFFGGRRRTTIEQALDSASLTRTVRLRAPSPAVLAEMVKGTDLIITLPSRLKDSVFKDFACCPLPLNLSEIPFDMIWHRRNQNSARNTFLRKTLISVFDEYPALL